MTEGHCSYETRNSICRKQKGPIIALSQDNLSWTFIKRGSVWLSSFLNHHDPSSLGYIIFNWNSRNARVLKKVSILSPVEVNSVPIVAVDDSRKEQEENRKYYNEISKLVIKAIAQNISLMCDYIIDCLCLFLWYKQTALINGTTRKSSRPWNAMNESNPDDNTTSNSHLCDMLSSMAPHIFYVQICSLRYKTIQPFPRMFELSLHQTRVSVSVIIIKITMTHAHWFTSYSTGIA